MSGLLFGRPDGSSRIPTVLRYTLRSSSGHDARWLHGAPSASNRGLRPCGEVCYSDAYARRASIRESENYGDSRTFPGSRRASSTGLPAALTMSRVEKHGIIFDEKHSPESAYVLLSGVARITCRNRKGDRTLVIMVAPGMIPGFPPPVAGISYNFRCEAVTDCQIGTVALATFIEIALGIASADFKRMAASYSGRWDLVQLRCANFMSCTLEERVALILLELATTSASPTDRECG